VPAYVCTCQLHVCSQPHLRVPRSGSPRQLTKRWMLATYPATSSCVRPALLGSYVAVVLRTASAAEESALISSLTNWFKLGPGLLPALLIAEEEVLLMPGMGMPAGMEDLRGPGFALSSAHISLMLFFWAMLQRRRAAGAAVCLPALCGMCVEQELCAHTSDFTNSLPLCMSCSECLVKKMNVYGCRAM